MESTIGFISDSELKRSELFQIMHVGFTAAPVKLIRLSRELATPRSVVIICCMAETTLTQSEADALLKMEKYRANETSYEIPPVGGSIEVPLVSANNRESFLLDIYRGRVNLKKVTYQNRVRTAVILARLDLGGPPHENPDGEEISCPHLHIYREGYGDKWATPISEDDFPRTDDLWISLQDFMKYCRITKPPFIERGLFV